MDTFPNCILWVLEVTLISVEFQLSFCNQNAKERHFESQKQRIWRKATGYQNTGRVQAKTPKLRSINAKNCHSESKIGHLQKGDKEKNLKKETFEKKLHQPWFILHQNIH